VELTCPRSIEYSCPYRPPDLREGDRHDLRFLMFANHIYTYQDHRYFPILESWMGAPFCSITYYYPSSKNSPNPTNGKKPHLPRNPQMPKISNTRSLSPYPCSDSLSMFDRPRPSSTESTSRATQYFPHLWPQPSSASTKPTYL